MDEFHSWTRHPLVSRRGGARNLGILCFALGATLASVGPERSGAAAEESPSPTSERILVASEENEGLRGLEREVRDFINRAQHEADRVAGMKAFLHALGPAEALLERRPDKDSRDLLLQVYLGARLFERAAESARVWIGVGPPDWRAYFFLGRAHMLQLRYEDALDPLEMAWALARTERSRHEVVHQRVRALEKLRRFEEALVLYEEMGDGSGARRIQRKIEDAIDLDLGGCVLYDELDETLESLEEEARRLEEELRALETDG